MVVTEDAVLRRFHDLHDMTQHTVEVLAGWINHYNKDRLSIDLIVDVWQRFFISSNDTLKVTLFYVMHQAVSDARTKHFDYVISAFQPAILQVIPHGRAAPEVRHIIERCLGIYENRDIFTQASVQAMRNILENGDAADPVEGVCLTALCRRIEAFDKARYIAEEMLKDLADGVEGCNDLKATPRDRQHAYSQMKEAETVLNEVIDMRHCMEDQKKKQLELIESLVLAQRFFSTTSNDATSVDSAYRNYYDSLKKVQQDLMEMERTGIYPAATPPRDAPSPTANDDIYATGVENALNNLRAPIGRANLEATDMDVDEDEPEPSAPTLPFPVDFTMPPPIRPMDAPTAWPTNPTPTLVSPGLPHNYTLPPPVIPTTPSTPQAPPNLVSPAAIQRRQLISPGAPGMPPSDPRQAYQMGQPPIYNVPPPTLSIPPPQLNQPPPSIPGQGTLRDPRQVNQRMNNNPPPRAPYNMPQEAGNPNEMPLGVRDTAGDPGGYRAPYKQEATTSATEAPATYQPTESSSHRDGYHRGDRDRGIDNNGSWRNDDRHGGYRHNSGGYGHGRYDDRRGRDDRRTWDRDRNDGWNRRDSGGGHRYNDNRRERGSYSRDKDRNGYGGDRGHSGRDGYDRGSRM